VKIERPKKSNREQNKIVKTPTRTFLVKIINFGITKKKDISTSFEDQKN